MEVNLIGISGHSGHGKDLVASIIQYLIAYKKYNGADSMIEDELKLGFSANKDYSEVSDWKIVKFADKLKDIICLLIGCTRADLESQEFKSKELGEEWWRYYHPIDVLGRIIEHQVLFKPTPRYLLQTIGTNLIRNQLHENAWINATFADYKEKDDWLNTPLGEKPVKFYPNWIISDTRFENEVKAIKDRGGIIIRVKKPCPLCGKYNNMFCSHGYHGPEHESETALDDYQFDEVIENNGTIEDLIEKVKIILIKYNII